MENAKQLVISVAITAPVFVVFALAAHGCDRITPQTQPDCNAVVCTEDGVGQPEPNIS